MEDFQNLETPIQEIKNSIQQVENSMNGAAHDISEQEMNLDDLQKRMSAIFAQLGASMPQQIDEETIALNDVLNTKIFELKDKTEADKAYDLNKTDVLIACLAGGIAILVDFFIVKIPKNMNIHGVKYEGSPLTKLIKKIGIDEEGKEATWIKVLEKWFHVAYDKSTSDNIPGMYPKNHRVYSLSHDPGIIGLIWGIKDIVCGTFSYIDKSGVLHIEKIASTDFSKIFSAPVLWLGHIISDIFTKQGIPIPGTCVLRTLQVGSFGEKNRTIGEIVEYMYVQGYDLRHLATMSTCKLAIDVIIKLYSYLISDKTLDKNSSPLFEKEYIRVRSEQKKRKLFLLAYAIATAGNIGKVAAYHGSPLAINTSIWIQFAKESISQVVICMNNSKPYLDAIENRHLIDESFDRLLQLSSI